MNNDKEIRAILLEILRVGLLRIRALGSDGSDGSARQCSVEADHLHNLPGLVESLRLKEILYYYDIERPGFLRSTTSNTDQFKPLWDQLAELIRAAKSGRSNPHP